MSCRASRAGACTIWVSASAFRSGADGRDGAAEGPGAVGCGTVVVQPERAETATVSRSVAVVVVRCTRATLVRPTVAGAADLEQDAPHG
ncbi:hypothetical protein GCM10010309_53740 [Streptomyces violaceochromogenes]|nr:hypothetical protein GCM10010309_53740 [Streptomyces violaceochromogenes]